ncbi:hypothetical protein [Kitasatospora sp. NPDC056531]|uniref:cupredoxin domain-containing protein n=1 Tax=Kitasatospora sp. NPDC056531 TaxID=3345856 RepID=UPI00368160EA
MADFGVSIDRPNGLLAFDPEQLTISAGDTVTWTNLSSSRQIVTFDSGSPDSVNINPGSSFRFTFDSEGVFPYRSDAGAAGEVTVNP